MMIESMTLKVLMTKGYILQAAVVISALVFPMTLNVLMTKDKRLQAAVVISALVFPVMIKINDSKCAEDKG